MSRQQLLKVITILDLDCKTTKEIELFTNSRSLVTNTDDGGQAQETKWRHTISPCGLPAMFES